MESIIAEIVKRRKQDIEDRGFSLGFKIPEKRTRPVNPFMTEPGMILEVKRASPSKGDIAPDLNPVETALKYRANGAKAISCLTEENYFKGSLQDLIDICAAVPDVAVLRKDFLFDIEDVDIAYRCGADAVLLISGMLSFIGMLSMAQRCKDLGIRAFAEVRTNDDVQKVLSVKKLFPDTVVCGVNSRNLKDFSIDLLVPAMLKEKIGGDVVFESGVTTEQAAEKIASMGFAGILLGEFAARDPERAGRFVRAFENGKVNLCGRKFIELAERVSSGPLPLVKICGLTRAEDVLLADSLGADFTGFIFAAGFERNVCGEKFNEIKKVLPKVRARKAAVITDVNSAEAKEAVSLVKEGVLDFIQLHGIKYEDLTEEIKELPHYFAITAKNGNIYESYEQLNAYGEARILQDAKENIYAGREHLWIAGGITDGNVYTLVRKFRPELIDVSGGLEDEGKPGIKNAEKMKKFFSEIARARIFD